MASDVVNNGMFLELYERRPPRELILLAFYFDADGSMKFERYRDDVPSEVEAWFRQEAERRLTPAPDA
jgi:hypothetical protein